jgi:hypothetical protein
MSIGRAAELAWALGYEAEFILHDIATDSEVNQTTGSCPAFDKVVVSTKVNTRHTSVSVSEYEAA